MAIELEEHTYTTTTLTNEVAIYQKRIFLGLEEYSRTSGDEIWSSQWGQFIHDWLVSRSTGQAGTFEIAELVKNCKWKVDKLKWLPNELEFADLFLAYPTEAFLLWYFVESLYQFDSVIMRNQPQPARLDVLKTTRPLHYLQNSFSEASHFDPITFERFRTQILLKALNFNNAGKFWEDYLNSVSHGRQKHEIYWIFKHMKSEMGRRNKALKKLEKLWAEGLQETSLSKCTEKRARAGIRKRTRQSRKRVSVSLC